MSTNTQKMLKSQFRKGMWLIFYAGRIGTIDYFNLKIIIIIAEAKRFSGTHPQACL